MQRFAAAYWPAAPAASLFSRAPSSDSLRASQGLTGADVIQVDVALIESPVGDRYLNEDLWTVADDQVLTLERKSLLEDNGFRIAQVGGIPPAQLQALLTSERSCIDSRRFHLHANTPTPISLGSPISECSFQVHQSGAEQPVTLEHASCSLLIVPTLGAEGKTQLLFTPQIESGNPEKFYGAAPDRSAWILQEQRPTVKYTALSWELSLDPNEYVVVGSMLRSRRYAWSHVFRPHRPARPQTATACCPHEPGAAPRGKRRGPEA